MNDTLPLDQNEQQQVAVTDQTPPPAEREKREIAPFVAGGPLASMIPQTPEEYARMAGLLIDAGCVPASYESRKSGREGLHETRAKLIIGLMKSVEIGVPPITGLNGIMIVNNRPSVWGDLAASLIQRSGVLERMSVMQIGSEPAPGTPLGKWDDGFGFRVCMWRRGQVEAYVGEFTVADAKRAALWENTKKQPWIYYPKDMLFNRARAKAQTRGFADCLHGMGIVEVERDLVSDADPRAQTENLLSDEPEIIAEDGGDE